MKFSDLLTKEQKETCDLFNFDFDNFINQQLKNLAIRALIQKQADLNIKLANIPVIRQQELLTQFENIIDVEIAKG